MSTKAARLSYLLVACWRERDRDVQSMKIVAGVHTTCTLSESVVRSASTAWACEDCTSAHTIERPRHPAVSEKHRLNPATVFPQTAKSELGFLT